MHEISSLVKKNTEIGEQPPSKIVTQKLSQRHTLMISIK